MPVIKVKWLVDELVNVMTQFDVSKVYWSATEGGVYAEATGVGTRPLLVADQSLYYFDHTAGDSSYWYKVSYFHTSTLLESDLSNAFQASEAGGYVTLEEIRAAGITVTIADDPTVIAAIIQWSQFIDRACRQWFEPRYLDEKLDGNGTRMLFLMAPIIGVDALYVNGELDVALDADAYEVYNNLGQGQKDDRRHPRVVISDSYANTDLFRRLAHGSDLTFSVGRKNQRIVGTFGFVEPDGATPAMIHRAVMKMVVKQLNSVDPLTPAPTPAGPLVSETTDGHTVRFASMVAGRKIGTIGITGDSEVEAIIQLYKAPRAMEASADA